MEIEYQYTREDFFQFNKSYCAFGFKKRIFFIILGAFLIPFFTVDDKSLNVTDHFVLSSVILILLIILSYIIPLLIGLYRISKMLEREGSALEKNKLTVTDEGLQIESESKTVTRIWESMVSANSINKFVYIRLVDKRALIFPDRIFASHSERANFLGIIQNKIKTGKFTFNHHIAIKERKPSYTKGLWCLIPIGGAVYGIILAANGISKYKDKWFVLMGLGGIAFTILLFLALSGPLDRGWRGMFVPNAQNELNDLVKSIEFYKFKHGTYPDSLDQLSKEAPFAWVSDPTQSSPFKNPDKNPLFNYRRAGDHYYLFSQGVDRIPGTADDIYPMVTKADSGKIGLIISK